VSITGQTAQKKNLKNKQTNKQTSLSWTSLRLLKPNLARIEPKSKGFYFFMRETFQKLVQCKNGHLKKMSVI
jgi:hypothetical protein